MPGPAPPIVDGLQIDQSLDFQHRFHRVQVWAWRLLALLPVAAVAGLFSGGIFSETTARGTGVSVVYDRFARRAVDTEFEVSLERTRSPATVAVSREFMDGYDLSEVRPRPERVTATREHLLFTFTAVPGASVTFTVQPQRLGSAGGTVTAGGQAPARLHQFVFP